MKRYQVEAEKYYPGEYDGPIYFDKNLTIHAHFKKIKDQEIVIDEEENKDVLEGQDEEDSSKSNNGKSNKDKEKKEKKPKNNK